MSLLLEALKRAERQRHPVEPAASLLSDPPPASPATPEPFPELSMTLEPLPELDSAIPAPPEILPPGPTEDQLPRDGTPDLIEPPVAPPRPADPPKPQREPAAPKSSQAMEERREKARIFLDNKGRNRKLSAARRRKFILGGIALAIAVATGGALFWLDRELSAPPLQAAVRPVSPAEPAPMAPVEDSQVPAAAAGQATPTGTITSSPARTRDAAPPATGRPSPPPSEPTSAARPAPVVQRSEQIIVVHPAAAAGYAAMANGNLAAARDSYREALKSNQGNRDALLGLAVTALREGHGDEAARRYEQLLALDPRDADANAGIALLRGAVDPVASESRLKAIIAERGDNAALHHALGSVLARQNRWGEAQEAFFRAVTLAPLAADYQFNLAVSLDHLGQYAPARTYYRKALDAWVPGVATFSRDAVQARIAAIDALSP